MQKIFSPVVPTKHFKWVSFTVIFLISISTLFFSVSGAKLAAPIGGYEGDVSARTPEGKGAVGIADWVLIGRFVAGDDAPQSASEFQRTDVAPADTKGDGRITIADWAQAGRYATGIDPLTAAGGPTTPNIAKAPTQPNVARDLRIVQTSISPTTLNLAIEYEAAGNENAMGFSLTYDQNTLGNPQAAAGSDLTGAQFLFNNFQANNGKLGFAIALSAGQTFSAGTKQLVTLSFAILRVGLTTQLTFGNSPVGIEFVGVDPSSPLPLPNYALTNITINNPVPTLTAISPTSLFATTAAFNLTVTGTNFNANSVVRWNGANRPTTLVSSTQLTAAITANDIASAGNASVTVENPAPGGGTTSALTFTIIPPNPLPTISGINPNSIPSGSSQFTLTVNGTGYVNGAIVRWNGADRTTTFVSATQLTAVIPATDVTTAGTAKVTVFNPPVGGGTSATTDFTIIQTNPLPTLTSINPTTVLVGGGDFTLTVTGTNFVSASKVKINGVDRTTTFVSGTQLNAVITAADIANVGEANITVFSPTPGGGTTSAVKLAINNPVPSAPTFGIANLTAGTTDLTLMLTGSNFRPNSIAKINGADRATTYVSGTQLKVTLIAADVRIGNALKFTIFTPTPGGGTSPEATLNVNNPAPAIASLNPPSTYNTLPAFDLTVNGTGFNTVSIVRWNGTDRATTFVSSTQLIAKITANDIANAGTAAVTVFNPTPGGGTSAAANFTIEKLTGYEGDITPRPAGKNNGTVSIADWVQAGRFFVSIDKTQNASEFQRADSAPRATKGDGVLTIADWVQAGRFAAGLDGVTIAGGPTTPAAVQTPTLAQNSFANEAQPRLLGAKNGNYRRDQIVSLPIEVTAQGNENAFAFSLNFDARVLQFSDVALADASAGATVSINRTQAATGRIGIALALPVGQALANGTQTILQVRFIPAAGAGETTTQIHFTDDLLTRQMSDAFANLLPQAEYANATITVSGAAVANVIAANYLGGELATDSIASAFGANLATTTEVTTSAALPKTMGGTSIEITDSKGITHAAALFFVSPSQINYQIPSDLAEGVATIKITNSDGVTHNGLLNITRVAPGLFSADATGTGYAAASVVYVKSDGQQSWESAAHYDAAQSRFVTQPIDVSGDNAYLILYGTGLRNRSALSNAKIRINGREFPVEYAGAQGFYAGVDQINIKLSKDAISSGEENIELIIDGKTANLVRVVIK